MNTAWLYAAVSSDKQTDDLPAQEAWAKSIADREGWVVTRTFSDSGTGKHGPRKLIRQLLDELRATKNRPDVILMNRLDRFGRGRALDSQIILAEITALGAKVYTREGGFVQNESWTDELINAVRFAVARQENEAKADRSRAGHARKRSEGKHSGHAPYGTVLIDGTPHPYEPEAAIVRGIFERYVYLGWGRHRLGVYAKSIAPPKKKTDGSSRSMRWSQSTIGSILHCPTHRGTVVDESLWEAAQSQARRGPFVRSSRFTWPLRGVLKCTCGHGLTGHTGSKNKTIRYYACRYTAGHGGIVLHRADALEQQFEQIIHHLPLLIDPKERYEESNAQLESLTARRSVLVSEMHSIETRKARVWELAERAGIPDSEVAPRLNDLTKEKTRLQSALDDLERELVTLEHTAEVNGSIREIVGAMAPLWKQSTDDEAKREVVSAVSAVLNGLYASPEERGILKTGLDEVLTTYQKSTQMQAFVNTATALRLASWAQSSRTGPLP